MTVPCYGCQDRRAATRETPSCHATCERYAVFWAENRRRNADNMRESDLDGMKIEGLQRAEKIARLVKGRTYQRKK